MSLCDCKCKTISELSKKNQPVFFKTGLTSLKIKPPAIINFCFFSFISLLLALCSYCCACNVYVLYALFYAGFFKWFR